MDLYDNGHGWMNGGGMFIMLLFWVIIVALGFWLVSWLTRREKSTQMPETSRQILDRRLASGEIDAASYAQARRLIEGHGLETPDTK